MKKLSRRSLKVAPLILLGLILVQSPVNQPAQALVGGPFDDNQYPGADADGTYSGTITGNNLIGMVTFGVDGSQESNGRFSVFHEGFVHYGAASGFADLASRRVAGSLLGVAALPTETTGGSGTTQSSGQAITVRSSAEGAFIAQMKGYPQQITFEGEGRLSTTANTAVITTPTANPDLNPGFTVLFDVFGSPQGSSDFSEGEGSSVGQIAVDGTPQQAILRTETPFKIRGSRTSRTTYTALNSYSSIAPIDPLSTPAGTGGTPTPVPAP